MLKYDDLKGIQLSMFDNELEDEKETEVDETEEEEDTENDDNMEVQNGEEISEELDDDELTPDEEREFDRLDNTGYFTMEDCYNKAKK